MLTKHPWLDPFHDMRGLIITNAATPGVGPQQQIVTAGVKLSLQTRVYNYSFKPMPDGTKVKVRFYGMEWNVATNRPANEKGESFLIGETALSPIAPFDNSRSAPLNWVLAGTTFDTTGYVNKDRMVVGGWDLQRAYAEMKQYDFYTRLGHKPYKRYVEDYYRDHQTQAGKTR